MININLFIIILYDKMKRITNAGNRIMVPKKIIIKNEENIEDVVNRLFFVRGKNNTLVVLHRDCVVCPLCKSKSNRNGLSDYGSQQYICGNKGCKHPFVPNKTLPDADHSIYEMIKGVECLYKKKMSLRKASDHLKTKSINISHHGVRGWKRVVPDLLRALLNSLKAELNDEGAIDAVKSIKKSLSWLRPWRSYEYAKISVYTPRKLLKERKMKHKVIEVHEKDSEMELRYNKPLTMRINKNDKLAQRVMMAALNDADPALLKEISDAFDVTEYIVTTSTKKYLEGGSASLIDKRGGGESKLIPIVMERILSHLFDSWSKSEKINNKTIAKRVNRDLESENLKISREIVRQFRNTINFDKTLEKLDLIKRASATDFKKNEMRG